MNKKLLLYMEFDEQFNNEIEGYNITFNSIIESLMDELNCATYTAEKYIWLDLTTGETLSIYD